MSAPYLYDLLIPSRAPDAERRNDARLGPTTLGVEVTEATLAARCGLGNIDPQHSGADATRSAIEAALDWPLPPDSARLATLRKDADALGAMAILTLRSAHAPLDAALRERVRLVAEADRFAQGPWPGPRPLPGSVAEIDEVGFGPQGLGAMIGGLPGVGIAEGVAAMSAWLTRGDIPGGWAQRARAAAATLLAQLAGGEVRVRMSDRPGVALVEGAAPGALRLGYRLAPVVVALGDVGGLRKIAIAQHDAGHVDLAAVAARLNRAEPGWGGSPTIIGSPQGVAAQTSLDACLAALDAARG